MKNKFTPLMFLISLGAGGIAISGFSFLNYTAEHGKGLVYISQILSINSMFLEVLFYRLAEIIMGVFALIHVYLTIYLLKIYIPWLKSAEYKIIKNDPLKNASLVTPFISLAMTMNVFLGVIRYFIPIAAQNLQMFMFSGFIIWFILWLALMKTEISLLKISFSKNFDISQINFGWLLHPFALGMVTVTGMGIAALAQDYILASTAMFLSLISGTMGLFLLTVKLITLFKSHITAPGLPKKQFLPSFLIVIPNITLYAISFFRFGHYLETKMHFEMGSYFIIVMLLSFTFEIWYLSFGIALLRDYLKKEMREEFHISQWGFICPFVAFSVLAAFIHNLFIPSLYFSSFILLVILFTASLFFYLLNRHIKCVRNKKIKFTCMTD
ncbi:MAG: hypothetical protein KAS02_03000 [Candidatus Pacebacteria bacterium]|nr:hypothetical protein [Candidatus Paceibacterota bacterium]